MTRFVILTCSDSTTQSWIDVGTIDAHSSDEAKRKGYLKLNNKSNVVAIVAVPARSWRPTPIRLERVEKVVLGEEKKQEPKA